MLEVFCKRYLQIPDHVVHSWRFSTGHSTMSRLSFRPGAHVINELINWAWDNSRIRDLIEATVLERPSNLTMRKLAEELGVSVPVLSLRDRLSGYLDVIMRWFSPY
jgi:hypothetical protein